MENMNLTSQEKLEFEQMIEEREIQSRVENLDEDSSFLNPRI